MRKSRPSAGSGGQKSLPITNSRCNPLGGLVGVLVLPNADGKPSGLSEFTVSVAVAFPVGYDLPSPEFAIGLGPGRVLGTAVPKTAIDEHGNLQAGKNNVSLAAVGGDGAQVDTVAETHAEEDGPERKFRGGVTLAAGEHTPLRLR